MCAWPPIRHCAALLVVVLPLAWFGQASAGWRYAEWRMTPDEVIAASDGTAKSHFVANRRAWGEYPKLAAPYRDGELTFEAWFYFDRYSGGLKAVRLVPTGNYWCIDVRAGLTDRYGTVHSFDDGRAVWTDEAHDNRISLIGFRGCSVKYEPLSAAKGQ